MLLNYMNLLKLMAKGRNFLTLDKTKTTNFQQWWEY